MKADSDHTAPGGPGPAGRLERELTICNSRGLHARASAKFVKCAEGFDAAITVSRDGQSVPGTSIMGLMMLAAHPGSTITVRAEGPDAEAAIDALDTLVASKFDED
ncbi:HPr family phosphocarrier protein [Kaustia mangrovi]|uniref:HPr family phosphocarrier protein n=1 Tax=Kaustia mangrovi TaxID=2593653 RepID=A0A7S8HBT9_9HYPH|nr:HPr family phosphocarrier protein [Kaustia mangrovi]QPC42553.1 HPr family phosphocarrier protein [Kaustia mangrovi]